MGRPNKYRKICELPEHTTFGPINGGRNGGNGNGNGNRRGGREAVLLTVDEYEVLRLIDYEGMNQEECAIQMDVARSTVQRVYNIARKKLITMLVEGHDISIEGGNYILGDQEHRRGRGCGPGCRHNREN